MERADLLKSIARKANLREGPQGVENVLRGIFKAMQDPGTNLNERTLARMMRMPVPVITSVCRELLDVGAIEPEPPVRLSASGIALIRGGTEAIESATPPAVPELKPASKGASSSAVCLTCEGTGISPVGAQWERVLVGLRRYVDKPASPEELVRRVAVVHEQAALAGKDVLVVGDDLSPAVAVGLLGKELSPSGRLARRVVALHYDERRLRHLRDIAVAEGVLIGLVRHDLRQPLMEDLLGEFGTVWVTPPTHDGLALYLSRAIDAAMPEGGRIFLVSQANTLEQRLETQRAISDMGVLVDGMLAEHGRGQVFYSLRVTDDTTPMIEDEFAAET